MSYKENAFLGAFFCKNIWSYQKKAVPLHSLLRNKCVSIFYRSPDIKIQIHLRGPNFFAPNRRIDEANWKIDTISVVQELRKK